MAKSRAPMHLHLKAGQLHTDLGKAPGSRLSEADLAREKAKGGVYARRAQFAENAKHWKHGPKKR